MSYSTQDLRHIVSGRAVEAGDGMLHIEGEIGATLCGRAVTTYPLRWDLQTVIACGSCLVAAGVPFRAPSSAPRTRSIGAAQRSRRGG